MNTHTKLDSNLADTATTQWLSGEYHSLDGVEIFTPTEVDFNDDNANHNSREQYGYINWDARSLKRSIKFLTCWLDTTIGQRSLEASLNLRKSIRVDDILETRAILKWATREYYDLFEEQPVRTPEAQACDVLNELRREQLIPIL